MNREFYFHKHQTGVVLIVGLIFLVIMTLIGTYTLRSSSMQERIGSNLFERNLSFQAAESALLDGEAQITALTTLPSTTATCNADIVPCILSYDPALNLAEQDDAWWQANSNIGNIVPNLEAQPRYVIQYVESVSDDLGLGFNNNSSQHFYAITARGTSGQGSASVVRSTFTRQH